MDNRHISIFGWEPCDEGNLLDKLTKPLVNDIECKCCILIRGVVIGIILTSIVLLIF